MENKEKRCIIYLADLAHNYASRGPFTMPLNIGYIAAYAKKVYGDKIEIKLFKFPLELMKVIKEKKPDIVGFSNYTWNLDINNKLFSWIKKISGEIVTVCGGPNYPITHEESLKFFKERCDLDFYILNQGEAGFSKVVERYFQCNSLEEMKKKPLNNCSFYDKNSNQIILGSYNPIENLDEIPSPYLSGMMDEFFTNELIPLIETNRGCPYSCTYCAWGKSSQKKVLQFPLERVKKEIEYIAKRVKGINLFMVADANFGIFERDIEICKFLRLIKNKYGYPGDLFIAWAKKGPHKIIKMIDILGDLVTGMTSTVGSFQSMNPKVLASIKRTNINLDDFKKIQNYLAKKGISTSSELILGLPKETKESHLNALKKMFDNNASSIVSYNLMMLGGAELNSGESRKKFGLKTKFRLIDGGFGKYGGLIAIEHQEVVLNTNTMNEEEILYFRPIHFLIQFLWNYRYYESLINFIKSEGINPLDFIIEIFENNGSSPDSIKKIFNDFEKEMYEEWFDKRKNLVEYYSKPKNFEFISKGGFGKLNYKYAYRFLLECKSDFDSYIFKTAEKLLRERRKFNDKKRKQLLDLLKFSRNIFIDFRQDIEEIPREKILEFDYDIIKWKKEGFNKPLKDYSKKINIRFIISEEQIIKLKELLEQFKGKDMNQTLRKMVGYTNEKILFYAVKT